MKKPLKVAAWSGILVFVVPFLSLIIQQILILSGVSVEVAGIIGSPFSMAYIIFGILFTYGFIVLANKFDATLLKVMAWIGIVIYFIFLFLIVIGLVFSLVGLSVPSLSPEIIGPMDDLSSEFDFEGGDLDGEDFEEFLGQIIVFVIILWLIIIIPLSIYVILFGVGLLKLKDDVPLAKAAGILNIISGATLIIFIGFFIAIAAYIVEVVMMFKASEKFERRLKQVPKRNRKN